MLDLTIQNLIFAFLMSFRLGAFFRTMPAFSEINLSLLPQVLLPVLLSMLIAPLLGFSQINVVALHAYDLFLIIAGEVLIGAMMGFAVNLIFVLATMIGEVAGMQAGFSMATLFDPNLGQVSVLSYYVRMVFMMLFFWFDLHHVFLQGIVDSYQSIPMGAHFFDYGSVTQALIRLFASVYVMGLRVVLPIILIILMSNLTMGLISVTAPQMNIYFNAAVALNVVVALVIFILAFPAMIRLFQIALGQLEEFLRGFLLLV